ncbi:hypothetical protein LINPERPRIM_LOCUS15331, partial [Linum perenne]
QIFNLHLPPTPLILRLDIPSRLSFFGYRPPLSGHHGRNLFHPPPIHYTNSCWVLTLFQIQLEMERSVRIGSIESA